jgi:hypothetical protein
VRGLNKKKTKLVVRNIKFVPKKEAIVLYLTLKKEDLF